MEHEFGRKIERARKSKLKRVAALVALLMVLSVLAGCMSENKLNENKPNGTYVWILNEKFVAASYTFDGNKVERTAFGETKKGTFKMEGNTVHITYKDGGKDPFEYNAEKDELYLGGSKQVTLVKEK